MTALRKCFGGWSRAHGLPVAMFFMALTLSLVLPQAAPAAGTWTNAGAFDQGRELHTATLLPNGKVLVAGGFGISGYLASAELYDSATGTWLFTSGLTTGRYDHTATLLPNGKVLVAGGFGVSGYLTSAELFDPATQTWSPTGSMATTRVSHTATLLPNGKVLVAGGLGNSGYLTGAELYDPATESWTATGPLATTRAYHTATLLPNGKVLVAGGSGPGGGLLALASAELYDPVAKTWTATGPLATARVYHTATLLPSGLVLVAGGSGFSVGIPALDSAELYDPVAETWTATRPLATARTYHTATLLPSGLVLVTGGSNGSNIGGSNGYFLKTEIYDPAVGSWTATGGDPGLGASGTATLLPNGKVLVAGGFANVGPFTYSNSAYLYDPAAGSWGTTGALSTGREHQTATLLPSGLVLVAGGVATGGASLASAELYDSAVRTWTATGGLTTGRYDHTATLLPNGKVLVAGGFGNSGPFLDSAELYDPATQTWNPTGSMATTRWSPTATLLPNGKVLVAGGYGNSGYLTSAELYNPATQTWSPTGSMATARSAHTATLLSNGMVLVSGGTNTSAANPQSSAELYDPATEIWTATGSLTTAREYHTATLLPSGLVLVAGGLGNSGYLTGAELFDPAANFGAGGWTATGPLATARENHTATLLPAGLVLVAGGFNNINGFLTGAELYDPAANSWSTTGPLATARENHKASLLPSGQVLVGGGTNGSIQGSAELYDPGLGFAASWRPVVNSFPGVLRTGMPVQLTGSGFRGISEASGGATNDSPTDYPLVQLRRLDSEMALWLSPDPAHPFSATSFSSGRLPALPAGYYLLTVFTNGIPSISQFALAPSSSKGGAIAGPLMLLLLDD